MKYIYLLLFIPQMLMAQAKSDTVYVREAPVELNFIEENTKELQSYIDSVNSYFGGRLPNFLLNECFDWDAHYLWEGGMHSPQSVRWVVLAAVTNMQALKAILNTNSAKLKYKCWLKYPNGYPSLKMPLIKQSTHQLLKKRLRQIKS